MDYAGQPVVWIEHNIDMAPASRYGRWWAAYDEGGSPTLPLVMVDSGGQIRSGYVNFASVYREMVDAELARPAQGEMRASWFRVANHIRVKVTLTNRTSTMLAASQNKATVHAIVYEDTKVHSTRRYARAAAAADIGSLAPGATATLTLETSDLGQGTNWGKLHVVALADYRPGGTRGAYDMIQAILAAREGWVYLPRLARW